MGSMRALIEVPGGLVGDQPGQLDFGGHVGQLVLGYLELGDFLPNCSRAVHIGKGPVESPLGRAQGLGGHQNPAFVEKFQHLVKPPALLPDEIRTGRAHS